MLNCFCTDTNNKAIPIAVVTPETYAAWVKKQDVNTKAWLIDIDFQAEPSRFTLIPASNGKLKTVLLCMRNLDYFWDSGILANTLPEGDYYFEGKHKNFALAWGLGAYQFTRYKAATRKPARLVLAKQWQDEIENLVESIYLVRDLINTPADDMGPTQLAAAAKKLALAYDAQFKQIVGEDLLKENYASIYTVGRASDDLPRLIDIRWGKAKHPKVTLVGKGVCFDTGGLDLKASAYMLLMKKDMAGAAHVLGLARMIMEAKLPVNLRVLIPAAENAVSGNAYRPGDVIKSRKGLTIEVGNTDAEGRVVLCDALAEAVSENPKLLIDISTLTGAARVAVGTDLAAVFSNNDKLANDVIAQGEKTLDPLWRLPLYAPYRELINSTIADINNNSSEPYAGAITAALFLKEFVPDNIPWLHFDIMAWNLRNRPGKPQGGEAMALRALMSYLRDKFK